jgi:ABC-2 type transport system permease protein
MFALIRFEIAKIGGQRRGWTGFLAIAAINALFALAFWLRLHHPPRHVHRPRGMDEQMIAGFINAQVYTQTILAPTLYILFPVILAIVGTHMLASEVETGSMRLMLCRPVRRWELVLAKFLALCGYSAVLLVALLLSSYAVSAALFKPTGGVLIVAPLFGLGGSVHILPASEAWWRLFGSYAFGFPLLATLCALALMLAAVTRHFATAATLASSLYIVSYIVTGIPILSTIHPFMPTKYLHFWRYMLMTQIPWDRVGSDALYTAGHLAVFLAVAMLVFRRLDL